MNTDEAVNARQVGFEAGKRWASDGITPDAKMRIADLYLDGASVEAARTYICAALLGYEATEEQFMVFCEEAFDDAIDTSSLCPSFYAGFVEGVLWGA